MQLNTFKREAENKSHSKQLRRAGKIPAVLYGKKQKNQNISIELHEFEAILRLVKSGHLSTTQFELKTKDGASQKALVKEIQYHPTTYAPLHIDFQELVDDEPINVKIPIVFTGTADCRGVKEGGVIRQVIRSMRVRCLPKHMPAEFQLDVRNLGMRQKLRLRDIDLPEEVSSLADLKSVAVVIVKR